MSSYRKVYQIRGSGHAGYYQGIDLWRAGDRYGSGSAGITMMGIVGQDEDGDDQHEFITVPVDRIDDLIDALRALRDEIVADEITTPEPDPADGL